MSFNLCSIIKVRSNKNELIGNKRLLNEVMYEIKRKRKIRKIIYEAFARSIKW